MGLIGLLAASTAVWVVARWRPFRVEVAGPSMEPALFAGDWAVATAARRIERGDVVVIGHPLNLGMEMVKRLTGVPGDRVLPDRALDPDEWFVSGDNADASTDSRTFGPVSRADIVGRARLVYWPPGRIGVIRGR